MKLTTQGKRFKISAITNKSQPLMFRLCSTTGGNNRVVLLQNTALLALLFKEGWEVKKTYKYIYWASLKTRFFEADKFLNPEFTTVNVLH